MKSAQELFSQLNQFDETPWTEAKLCSEVGKSLMETVNSYSNEPAPVIATAFRGVIVPNGHTNEVPSSTITSALQ